MSQRQFLVSRVALSSLSQDGSDIRYSNKQFVRHLRGSASLFAGYFALAKLTFMRTFVISLQDLMFVNFLMI